MRVNARPGAVVHDLGSGLITVLHGEELVLVSRLHAEPAGVAEAGDLGVVVQGGGVPPRPIGPGVLTAVAEEGGGDGRADTGLGGGREEGVVTAVGVQETLTQPRSLPAA